MSDIAKPIEADKALEAARQKEAVEATARIKEAKDYVPSHQDVLAEAQAGINEHPDHCIKAQGRAAERAAMTKMQADGQVTDLNKQMGAHFPIYDVASDKQVASVKCRGLEDGGQLRDVTKAQYIADLEDAAGHGTNPEKFANAARYLHADAQANPAGYPRELAGSPHQTEQYLREHSKLMIPDDHATQVKQKLSRRLFSSDKIEREVQACRLGLDYKSSNYTRDANAALARIEGIGINSGEIKRLMEQTPGVWNHWKPIGA